MNDSDNNTSTARPRWDGSRVLFEIVSGTDRIPCTISRAALQELSGARHFKSTELLRCFAESRGLIEGLAHDKLRARSEDGPSLISIWTDDIDDAIATKSIAKAG
jgi:hypothetical protein